MFTVLKESQERTVYDCVNLPHFDPENLLFSEWLAKLFSQKKTLVLEAAAVELESTSILENALDAVVGVDEQNRVIFWNVHAEAIFGWSKKEMLGQDMTEHIVPNEYRKRHREGMKRFIETGIPKIQNRRIEIPGLHRSGKVFPMELTVSSVLSNGHFRFYSFMRDVSEQKRAIEQLKERSIDLKVKSDALENSLNGFDIINHEGKFIYLNNAYLKMWGYESKDEVLGTSPASHCADPQTPIKIMTALKTTGECDIEFVAKRKDGSLFDVRMLAFLAHDPAGQEIYPSTSIDISEQKNLVRSLDESKREAERANDLKSAFLANMSHEIRTPLGALLGFADLLRDPGLSRAEQASYVDILMRNGQSLSGIINDILDLSKVEAGHLTLEYAECSPEDVAQDVISLLRVRAKEKGLVLEYSHDNASAENMVTDALRMRQVLLNLISNAIKFTPHGTVRLKSYGCESDDGKPAICFEVCDTGIGIPLEHQSRVFEMFVQGDGSMARRFGGTGLGLSLSRRLARALGGDVQLLSSEVGKGSTFLVKFVDQKEIKTVQSYFKKEEAREPGADALNGLRILVVDDSPDNQSLIWHYLTKRGALVESAENGLIGYKKALRENFDLVLMDIQMPEMDGYTATQRLREAGYQKPIVALTAHVLSDVRQKCLNVGCTSHLPKPINPKLLIATIAELTGR